MYTFCISVYGIQFGPCHIELNKSLLRAVAGLVVIGCARLFDVNVALKADTRAHSRRCVVES